MTKLETSVRLFSAWIPAHVLLAQPNLNPTLRSALQTVENEQLTKLVAGLLTA